MIDWWKFSVGALGTVGMIIGLAPSFSNLSYWFVGVAFLVMFVASFFK